MSIRFVQRPYRTSNLQSNTLKGTTAKGTVLADQESGTPYIETGMEGVIASEQISHVWPGSPFRTAACGICP